MEINETEIVTEAIKAVENASEDIDVIEEAKQLRIELEKQRDESKRLLNELKKERAEIELRGRSSAGQRPIEKTEQEKIKDAARVYIDG
jgi:hypothetical protein